MHNESYPGFARSHICFGLSLMLAAFLLTSSPVIAAGGASRVSEKPAEFLQAQKAIKTEKYQEAIPLLEGVLKKTPKDADTLNYLGYSHRKLGQFEVSENYYGRAIEADPKHRAAHEYLGELFLQTDRPEEAKKMLDRLDDLCFWGCGEYDDLKAAIELFAANGGVAGSVAKSESW
jgi:tetratricopeptide (TPR) repeat protein